MEIHKGVNVSIIFVLVIQFTFAQSKIKEGIYCQTNITGYGSGNCYSINKNGEFEYFNGVHNIEFYGLGEYTLKSNNLILNYNKTKPLAKGYHIPEFWKNNADSIEVYLNFYDFEHQPISNVNVIYKDSLQKNGYNGAVADKFGKIRLLFSKSNGSLELKCSNLGFNQYKLILDKTYNYQIDVFLAKQGLGIPIYKQIDTLKIIEFGKNYFIVKEKPDKETKWIKRE